MGDSDKNRTEAEKQIDRLRSLRQQGDQAAKASAQRAASPAKTQASRIEDRLRAMRNDAKRPPGKAKRARIDGRQKSLKVTYAQIRALDQLLEKDKRLKGSVVMRMALNRFLNLDNSPEELDLETSVNEILRQNKNRP